MYEFMRYFLTGLLGWVLKAHRRRQEMADSRFLRLNECIAATCRLNEMKNRTSETPDANGEVPTIFAPVFQNNIYRQNNFLSCQVVTYAGALFSSQIITHFESLINRDWWVHVYVWI